ncbi:uncharacterized protein LOC131884678 [Tigriopus californicus]|uniref:uncharacterized protein LOC131884678 n=1 Tax=Tigriopus californicus TaxID=6832 RepID=UPI0027DA0B38|nr:uncharacterized protein LOC131884678 [Tigriopus californicus]
MLLKCTIVCVVLSMSNFFVPILSDNRESHEEDIIQRVEPKDQRAKYVADPDHHEFYQPKNSETARGNRNHWSNDSDPTEMDEEAIDHEEYMRKVAEGPTTSKKSESSTAFTLETLTEEPSKAPPTTSDTIVANSENMVQIPEGKVLFYFPMLESKSGDRLPSVIGVPLASLERGPQSTDMLNNRMSGSSIFNKPKEKTSLNDGSEDLNPNKLFSCVPRYGCRMGLVCVDGLCHGCESTQECYGNEICVLGKPLIKFAMGLSLGIGGGTQARAHSKINRSVSPRQSSAHAQELVGLERLIGYMGQHFPEGTKRCVECGWISTIDKQKRSLGNVFRSQYPNEGLSRTLFRRTTDDSQIKIRFINISPLEIEIVSRNDQGHVTPLGTLSPPVKVSNCKAWTDVSVTGGVILEAWSKEEPQRYLYVGGRTEAKASKEWSVQESGVLVPIACQRHRFDLVENRAYDNGELDDWCF